MRRIFAAVLVAALLAGCGPMSDGGTGVVVDRERKEARNGPDYFEITTARDGSGTRDTGRVSKKVFDACRVGERWPACKESVR